MQHDIDSLLSELKAQLNSSPVSPNVKLIDRISRKINTDCREQQLFDFVSMIFGSLRYGTTENKTIFEDLFELIEDRMPIKWQHQLIGDSIVNKLDPGLIGRILGISQNNLENFTDNLKSSESNTIPNIYAVLIQPDYNTLPDALLDSITYNATVSDVAQILIADSSIKKFDDFNKTLEVFGHQNMKHFVPALIQSYSGLGDVITLMHKATIIEDNTAGEKDYKNFIKIIKKSLGNVQFNNIITEIISQIADDNFIANKVKILLENYTKFDFKTHNVSAKELYNIANFVDILPDISDKYENNEFKKLEKHLTSYLVSLLTKSPVFETNGFDITDYALKLIQFSPFFANDKMSNSMLIEYQKSLLPERAILGEISESQNLFEGNE